MTITQEVVSLLPFSINQLAFHHKGENENFAIKSSDNNYYILKRYREERKQRLNIEIEIDLCNYLRANLLEAPVYVPFNDGNFILSIDNRKYTIQKMISGFMICNPDERHFHEIGKSYRRLHDLKVPFNLGRNIPELNNNTLSESWSFLINSKHIKQSQVDQFEHYKNVSLKHLDFSSDNLVHFDLHDGNIIYTSKGLCMLDWEECGTGNGIFDLAVTNTRLIKLKNCISFRKALLNGYGAADLTQLKYATIFKFLYLASFVAKFEDVLTGNETLEKLFDRYLGYFEKLENE